MVCKNCGHMSSDNAKFCPICGEKIEEEINVADSVTAVNSETTVSSSVYVNPISDYQENISQNIQQPAPQQVTTKSRVCGIIGFACGIWSLVFSWWGVLPGSGLFLGFFSILAAIAGLILTNISNKSGGFRLTKVGKILSIIGLILSGIFWIIGLIMTISMTVSYKYY